MISESRSGFLKKLIVIMAFWEKVTSLVWFDSLKGTITSGFAEF